MALPLQGIAKVVVGVREIRFEPQGLVVLCGRVVEPAQSLQGVAQVVVSHPTRRIAAENAAIERYSVNILPALTPGGHSQRTPDEQHHGPGGRSGMEMEPCRKTHQARGNQCDNAYARKVLEVVRHE